MTDDPKFIYTSPFAYDDLIVELDCSPAFKALVRNEFGRFQIEIFNCDASQLDDYGRRKVERNSVDLEKFIVALGQAKEGLAYQTVRASIAYYNVNGEKFFANTVNADMSADRARFLKHVKPGGTILEAGCGSGRDALAFKDAGYAVTAIDGSDEMARLAAAHTGLPVQHRSFGEIVEQDAFDAIWVNASLLHIPRAELPATMARLTRALRPGGVWYMSFKYGDDEGIVHERHFTNMTEPLLTEAIRAQGLTLLDMWTSQDVRPERKDEIWLSAIARKPA